MSFISDSQAKKYLQKFKKRLNVDHSMRMPNISKQGLDLMRQMLTFNPFLRPDIDFCLAHPYFDEIRNPNLE